MWVIISILAMIVCYFLFYLIGLVLEPLFALLPPLSQSTQDTLKIIGGIAFFIVTDVYYYRCAYVKGKGKKWHFWLMFSTTIMFVIVFISMVTQ